MTTTERTYPTRYGPIHYGGPCRDDYPNVEVYDQGGGNTVLSLQRPAMEAFKAAEIRYAKRMRRKPWRLILPKNRKPRHIHVLPGTNRTCETQRRLYDSDDHRYAHPDITGHTRHIAIDVSQAQGNLSIIHSCLTAEGWTQTRPDDEPWHYSYGVTV